ncbi:cbb3-type cytochrome c oxidase N-terminal domain-containing protein [Crocinitomix catalasitica]|uniref:cbb3-type cytochrome c oxidase N-terminal domain-containing protein n=1 Tax=Crocinitomix catalasitica TaxID=184607 RepID=UPI0009FDFEC0|nr:cbb3-type cytochrome c oxidase N-terminal domain-containing protein [Crocinitomix catalasitica]
MNLLFSSIKKGFATLCMLPAFQIFSQTEAVSVAAPTRKIYDMLGMSSTSLFTVMTLFTVLLVFIMVAMAGVAKTMLWHKYDKKEKKSIDINAKTILVIGLLFSGSAMAAGNTAPAESLIPFSNSVFWAYVIIDIVLLGFIYYFAKIIRSTIAEDLPERKPLIQWKKITKNLTNAVEIEDEGSILIDHDYDGITELDNDLPPWWKYGFYITIVWAVVYFFYYQVFEIGNLQEAEYLAEMAEGEREVAEYKAAHPNLITAANVTLLEDASAIAKGKGVYDTYCMSCHMDSGRGGIGPNLTDAYWLYGNDISTVFKTISEGAANGMPAWKELMPANDIQAVASYVLHLEEIPAPDGKEPQGELKE